MPWLICLFAISTLFLLWSLSRPSSRLSTMGEKIPGPRAWPIVGNGFMFLKKKNGCHFLPIAVELCNTYGPVTRLWFGKQLWLFLKDPKDLAVILTSSTHLNKGDITRFLHPWLGKKGLVISDSDIWRPHRKLITPSFHFKILESYVGIMQQSVTIMCDRLRQKVDKEEFDILPYAEKCALDIICETTLGVSIGVQELTNDSADSAYLHAVKTMVAGSVKRAQTPWLQNDFVFRLTTLGRTYYRELKKVKTFANQVIEERKAQLQKEITIKTSPKDDSHGGRKGAMSLLNCMLLESNFTDEEIENEVQSFIYAGHETSTTTVSFCLFALSQHQDVQEKLYQEMRNVLGESEEEPTYEDYRKLRYLDCVIDETLRLYTIVPVIVRKVSEDILLPSGFTIPHDSHAFLFLYALHNDEKYFPNPDQFIPERFENRGDRENFTFLPFSAGPRTCMGAKFAKLEIKIIISKLLRNYKFLPSRKVQSLILDVGIVLESLNKHPVRITLRENATS